MAGADLIRAERQRQIDVEGFTSQYDDELETNGELSIAAAGYASVASGQARWLSADLAMPVTWPWGPEWWKPCHDPVRNLVKAGALICAEIDRLERSRDKAKGKPNGRGDVHDGNDDHTD